MRQLTLIFLIVFSSSLFGQDNNDGLTIIEKWIRGFQPSGQIVYTNKLDNWAVDQMNKGISERKISGVDLDSKQTIKLTKREQKYLFQKIELLRTNIWKDSLFLNSERIELDTVMKYIEDVRKGFLKIDPLLCDTLVTLAMQKNRINTNVFTFSKPIFIRDNSICLIFTTFTCGKQCGKAELTFYRLWHNREWIKYIVASAGIF
jgi:hypothetical protein